MDNLRYSLAWTTLVRCGLSLGMALVGGCTTLVPPPKAEVVTLPPPAIVAAAPAPVEIPAALTLIAAKQIALDRNPDIRSAIVAVEKAALGVRQAQAALEPGLDAFAGITSTQNNPQGFPRRGEGVETYSTGLRMSWLLYDGFARRFSILAAKHGRTAALSGLDDGRRLLGQAVAVAFFQALLAEAQVAIAEADAAFNAELLEETRKRMAADRASRADELNFRILVNNARRATIQGRSGVRIARIALGELLGLGEDGLPAATTLTPPVVVAGEATPAELVARALAQRPDMAELEARVAVAEAGLDAARAGWLPTLSLTSEYSFMKPEDPWFSRHDRYTMLGLTLRYNLYDGEARHLAWAQRVADLQQLRSTLARQRQRVIAQVQQQVEQVRQAGEVLELQQETVALTRESRELERQKYLVGNASVTRLNEVQTQLVIAEGQLALYRIGLQQALETLRAVVADSVADVPFVANEVGGGAQ